MEEQKQEILGKSKEFSYQEGVLEIERRVKKVLSEKKYVVVSISGSSNTGMGDIDVGKTTLQIELSHQLSSREHPVITCSNIKSIGNYGAMISHFKNNGALKLIFIIGAGGLLSIPKERRDDFKKYENLNLQDAVKSIRIPLTEVDMHILIYRPDRLPGIDECETADIIIRNDHAKTKNPNTKY